VQSKHADAPAAMEQSASRHPNFQDLATSHGDPFVLFELYNDIFCMMKETIYSDYIMQG
jgi:hypothetical protein